MDSNLTASTAPSPSTASELDSALQLQRRHFLSGATLSYEARAKVLKELLAVVKNNEEKVLASLHADLRKPRFEAYSSEVGVFYEEIKHLLKNLKKWMRPRSVATPWALKPSKSQIRHRPFGNALLFGPFNYPFQLILNPLAGLLAAGNTALVKPSELTPHTSHLIADLIGQNIDPAWVRVVLGGPEVSQELSQRSGFQLIVFTGSTEVGKKIASAAAANLTPTVLELGGKSPAILAPSANLEISARRIAWGKFFNAGQTCVAPDYLLVQENQKEKVLTALKKEITRMYGEDPRQSPHYGRIISRRHLERLISLIGPHSKVVGGEADLEELYLEPTVLEGATFRDPIMREEIFGPLLPVITYSSLEKVKEQLQSLPSPLALYFFSASREEFEQFSSALSFGGGAWNDTMVHLVSPELPLGGVGASGWGRYKGRHSFETFSHTQGLVFSSPRLDVPLRYPPYSEKALALLKKFLG